MPKFVDYPERVDRVRAIVYQLVLEEGTEALTLLRVAASLGYSPSTLKRLVSSASVLPALGMQWVTARERKRWLTTLDGKRPYELADWERSMHLLAQQLPVDDDLRDEERVFRALAGACPTAQWAVEAVAERRAARDDATKRLLGDLGLEQQEPFATLRLLIDGITEAVASGRLAPAEGRSLLIRHVQGLRGDDQAA